MSESNLENLLTNDLFDLMTKYRKEIVALIENGNNEILINAKKKELSLLQLIIVQRRAEFHPG